jgi:hypothetical protein
MFFVKIKYIFFASLYTCYRLPLYICPSFITCTNMNTKNRLVIFTAFANPYGDLGHIGNERNEIKAILHPLHEKGAIYHLDKESLNSSDFFKEMKKYQDRIGVFHFGGHSNEKLLSLEGGNAFFPSLAAELCELNKDALFLVFLNGCATKAHVSTLIKKGAKAVIATNRKVDDELAARFATLFYKNFAKEISLKLAFDSATREIMADPKYQDKAHLKGLKNPVYLRDTGFSAKQEKEILDGDDFPWNLYINKKFKSEVENKEIENALYQDAAEFTRALSSTLDKGGDYLKSLSIILQLAPRQYGILEGLGDLNETNLDNATVLNKIKYLTGVYELIKNLCEKANISHPKQPDIAEDWIKLCRKKEGGVIPANMRKYIFEARHPDSPHEIRLALQIGWCGPNPIVLLYNDKPEASDWEFEDLNDQEWKKGTTKEDGIGLAVFILAFKADFVPPVCYFFKSIFTGAGQDQDRTNFDTDNYIEIVSRTKFIKRTKTNVNGGDAEINTEWLYKGFESGQNVIKYTLVINAQGVIVGVLPESIKNKRYSNYFITQGHIKKWRENILELSNVLYSIHEYSPDRFHDIVTKDYADDDTEDFFYVHCIRRNLLLDNCFNMLRNHFFDRGDFVELTSRSLFRQMNNRFQPIHVFFLIALFGKDDDVQVKFIREKVVLWYFREKGIELNEDILPNGEALVKFCLRSISDPESMSAGWDNLLLEWEAVDGQKPWIFKNFLNYLHAKMVKTQGRSIKSPENVLLNFHLCISKVNFKEIVDCFSTLINAPKTAHAASFSTLWYANGDEWSLKGKKWIVY